MEMSIEGWWCLAHGKKKGDAESVSLFNFAY